MLLGKSISLVLPCHNEEASLKVLLPAVPPCVDEVLVVDNASTDNSAEVARSLGATVLFEGRKGYGFSIRRGLEAAKKDIVVVMDTDTTYAPEGIPRLAEILIQENLEFISGCRFPLTSFRGMPLSHRVGNRIITAFVNVLFGLKLADSQSGMWVFWRHVLPRMRLETGGMPFSTEIKVEAFGRVKLRARECRIPFDRERVGVSKLSPASDALCILGFLFRRKLGECGILSRR